MHTVQEATKMFANESTGSKSPEQLCLPFFSISAHRSGRVHRTCNHADIHSPSAPSEDLSKLQLVETFFPLKKQKNLTKYGNITTGTVDLTHLRVPAQNSTCT